MGLGPEGVEKMETKVNTVLLVLSFGFINLL